MYTFSHPATEQTGALTDYRYIGANPNNYVIFNNELWRIIGVFTVEDGNGNAEQRLKIVRNEKLSTGMSWDSNETNKWDNASLNTYLNSDYYSNLSPESKNMIVDTKYYLGGSDTNFGGAETYYNWERGTTVYSNRDTYWICKIALMYPSDIFYIYALGVDDTCYTNVDNCSGSSGKTNGWLYVINNNSHLWLLSPHSESADRVFNLTEGFWLYNTYSSIPDGVNLTLICHHKLK